MRQAPAELSQRLEAEPGSAGQSASRDGEAWPPQVPDDEGATFAAAAAVAAERARIAREMRDSASKSLLGITIAAASLCAPKRPSDPRWLEQRLRDLARLAQHAVSETRSVIDNLRDDPLGDAVRCVATAWGLAAGARVSLAVAPGSDAPAEVRREVVATLCELLDNVQRHAHASRVEVSLRTVPQGLSLAVADDGVGFRPPVDLRELASVGQHGLAGIAERVRQAGGALIIGARPGAGTRITVQIPVRADGRHQPPATAPPPVRIVVAEENPVLRSGLRAVLERAPELEIVAEACRGKETVEQVRRHCPDVLLFDAGLQMADGSAVIPQISGLTRVVVLTCADDGSLSVRAVDGGEHRYAALGEFEPSDLIQIVHDVARRSLYLAPPPRTAAFPGRTRGVNGASLNDRGGELTPREREVMGLIAEGLSNRQIAARLVISEKTVKNHICSIYQRIGAEGRSEAVSRWRQL